MPPVVAPALSDTVRAALPNFMIIGAPKAATTSLHAYLAVHPAINMSRTKEPMCFAFPDWTGRIERYPRIFRDHPERPLRGESSTAYTSYPWEPETPDRVLSLIPECRFVYLVRDPIERMLSHYAQNVWDGVPVAPFDELMENLEREDNIPVWSSRYAFQLERWTERFGRDRVLVLDQRDLLGDRAATVQRVLEFLGLDPAFSSPEWEREHNTRAQHRVPTALGRRLGSMARGPLRKVLTREVAKPTLTAAQHRRVVALLAPDTARFRALTGMTFDHWSI